MATVSHPTKRTGIQRFLTYRALSGLLALGAFTGMSFAYLYLQGHLKLDPCPLCIFQRVGLIVMGLFSLVAFILNPKKVWLRIALMLGALAGILWSIAVAIRHIWIQHLPPDQVPSCGPGLDYWMDTLPIAQVLKEVFKGSGECAVIDWTFLGFSIPEQSLAFFTILLAMIGLALYKANKS